MDNSKPKTREHRVKFQSYHQTIDPTDKIKENHETLYMKFDNMIPCNNRLT